MIAVGPAALEAGDDLEVVAVGEGDLKAVQLLLKVTQGAQHFVAVLFQDAPPKLGVAAGDARGVAQTAARVVAPAGVFLGEERTKRRRDHLGQVTDVRDDFVVLIRVDRRHFGAQAMQDAGEFNGDIAAADYDGSPRQRR